MPAAATNVATTAATPRTQAFCDVVSPWWDGGGQLKLSGAVLADIFLGNIKTWNDPAIAKLNSDVKLPATAIAVIHRADGSGTTFNFTDYLSKASPEWKEEIGEATSVDWPTGIGAKGNDGVANKVAGTEGAIGYVEYAYAKQQKLTYADMVNKEGKKVEPTVPAFQSAAANAKWSDATGYYEVLTDEPGAESWPLTAATFILMYKEPVDKAASAEALKFFDWAFASGDKMAEDLDYIPMPAPVVAQIKQTWAAQIKAK